MNFDYIEGLTEEQVYGYYDEIMENSSDNYISQVADKWEVKCSNGYTSYAITLENLPVGYATYSAENGSSAEFGSIARVCGQGIYGYTRVIENGEMRGTKWEVKCSNGYTTYVVTLETLKYIGWNTYTLEYNQHAGGGTIALACGAGRYGNTRIVSYF